MLPAGSGSDDRDGALCGSPFSVLASTVTVYVFPFATVRPVTRGAVVQSTASVPSAWEYGDELAAERRPRGDTDLGADRVVRAEGAEVDRDGRVLGSALDAQLAVHRAERLRCCRPFRLPRLRAAVVR